MIIHLIAFAVAFARGGVGRFTEGAVVSRGVFGGISHDRCADEVVVVEDLADRRHAAVHHIRGSHHIGAGFHMAQRGFG